MARSVAVPSKSIRHSAQFSLRLDLPDRIPEYDPVAEALKFRSRNAKSPCIPTSLSPWVLSAQFTGNCIRSSRGDSSASLYSNGSFTKSGIFTNLAFPVSASPTSDSWLTSPVLRGTPHRTGTGTKYNRRGMYIASRSGSDSSSSDDGMEDVATFTVEIVSSHRPSAGPSSGSDSSAEPSKEGGWSRALKRWSRPSSSNTRIPSPAGRKPLGPRPSTKPPPQRAARPATMPAPILSPAAWKPSVRSNLSLRTRRFPPTTPLPPVPSIRSPELTSSEQSFSALLSRTVEVDQRLTVRGCRAGIILPNKTPARSQF